MPEARPYDVLGRSPLVVSAAALDHAIAVELAVRLGADFPTERFIGVIASPDRRGAAAAAGGLRDVTEEVIFTSPRRSPGVVGGILADDALNQYGVGPGFVFVVDSLNAAIAYALDGLAGRDRRRWTGTAVLIVAAPGALVEAKTAVQAIRDAGTPLLQYLVGYSPQSDAEAVDVAQVKALATSCDPWSRAAAVHVTASALIVHPPSARVLLRWHARQQAWLHVGGHADPGEVDPLAVARREASEETGLVDLRPWPTSELQHVALVPVPANAHEPAHVHADVRFFLATDEPDAARPEKEDARLRWRTLADAIALTSEENVRETIRRAARALAG